MHWVFYLLVFSVIPAMASITYLLPEMSWAFRFKVLLSRGALKVPFGILFGFLAVVLLELFRQGAITHNFQYFLIGILVYLFSIWFYLYLYKLILNKLFKIPVTWSAIINSILIEVSVIALLSIIGLGISLAFQFSTTTF